MVRQQQQLRADDPLVVKLSGTPYDLLATDDDRTVDDRIIDAVQDGLIRWEDWVSPEDMAAAKADAQARHEELREENKKLADEFVAILREFERRGY